MSGCWVVGGWWCGGCLVLQIFSIFFLFNFHTPDSMEIEVFLDCVQCSVHTNGKHLLCDVTTQTIFKFKTD